MRLRLLRPWKYRKVGTILNGVSEGAGNLLIRRGVAEQVKELVEQNTKGIQRRVGRA